MENKKFIRSLLVLNNMTMSELAKLMTKELGKKYTRDSINGKLARESISLREC